MQLLSTQDTVTALHPSLRPPNALTPAPPSTHKPARRVLPTAAPPFAPPPPTSGEHSALHRSGPIITQQKHGAFARQKSDTNEIEAPVLLLLLLLPRQAIPPAFERAAATAEAAMTLIPMREGADTLHPAPSVSRPVAGLSWVGAGVGVLVGAVVSSSCRFRSPPSSFSSGNSINA